MNRFPFTFCTAQRNLHHDSSGQSLVEFALNLSVLILLLVGIFDLGRVVFVNTMLSAAAQAGARAGTVTATPASIEATVQSHLSGVAVEEVVIRVARTGEETEVQLRYIFVPITPLVAQILPDGGLVLEQSAQMRHLGVFVEP